MAASPGSPPRQGPPGQVPGPPEVERVPNEAPGLICLHCGVFAPPQGRTCEGCEADLHSQRTPAPAHRELWVAVKASFRCRSCDFLSPLDGLEQSERVYCAQCGALQRLEVSGWAAALEQLHAIADLRWPRPEGRLPARRIYIGEHNELAKGAGDSAFLVCDLPDSSGAALQIEAAPGHPTCHGCRKGALEITLTPGGREFHTRCRACGDQARYPYATIGAAQLPVIAPEARLERPRLRLETMVAGGPIALLCPRCGAPFSSVREEENVSCSHCDCVAYVPVRARQPRRSVRGLVRIAAPFFLAFHGPSAKRLSIESSANKKKTEDVEEPPRMVTIFTTENGVRVQKQVPFNQMFATHGTGNSVFNKEFWQLQTKTGDIRPAMVNQAAAVVPQILLSLVCAGVALAIGFVVVVLAGLIDVL